MGQSFLYLLDTHFLRNHIFNEIFNRNKVKVSYCGKQNIKAIINNHNINILHQNDKIKDECNCKNKKYCTLGGKCLSPDIVYQGKITSSQPNYNAKFTLELQKSHSKIDSTTTPNPLHMKITQMTQNCRKNTGTLNGVPLFQK